MDGTFVYSAFDTNKPIHRQQMCQGDNSFRKWIEKNKCE